MKQFGAGGDEDAAEGCVLEIQHVTGPFDEGGIDGHVGPAHLVTAAGAAMLAAIPPIG